MPIGRLRRGSWRPMQGYTESINKIALKYEQAVVDVHLG